MRAVLHDRDAAHLGRVPPGGAGVPPVVRLGEDAVPAGRVPQIVGRSRPRHVTDALRAEPPGERAVARGPGGSGAQLVRGDDRHRAVRLGRAASRARCVGVSTCSGFWSAPRPGDDVAGRERDLVVDVAVLEVELALAQYWSVFQPCTSSYTAIRGYHWASSKRAPSRPIRSAPCSGMLKAYARSSSVWPPGARGWASSRYIIVSSTRKASGAADGAAAGAARAPRRRAARRGAPEASSA